jgi:protein involved in polysaccharide export with SLBB domain
VNVARCKVLGSFISKYGIAFIALMVTLLCLGPVACRDGVHLPSTEQMLEFENAGPGRPVVDMGRLVRARIGGGPYRVVPGDVLDLTMPGILQIVTCEGSGQTEQPKPYVCRVNETGSVTLPVVGDIEVSGKTLSQIEADVVAAYYPAYAVVRPSVFARVLEYQTAQLSISGAVQKPGIYSLRSDQMSLVALLMEAGGIIDEGAARISIVHQDDLTSRSKKSIPKVLSQRRQLIPVHQTSTPFDVRLSFKQFRASSTVGEFTVTNTDNKVLVREHLDVAEETERQALVQKLAAREPGVSALEINEKLCALAEQLRPGSGYRLAHRQSGDRRLYADAAAMVLPVATDLRSGATAGEPGGASHGALYERMSEAGQEAYNRIHRGLNDSNSTAESTTSPSPESETFVLPVKGFNIPFADVVLHEGDSVIVERLQTPLFTVMGLVNKPGNFPYPPGVRYNLAQALAFAGGLNDVADPRYVTIYRLTREGRIVSVVLPIMEDSKFTDAAETLVKPGDIVAIEQTPRTRTAVFLDRVFRINIGTYWSMNNLWE